MDNKVVPVLPRADLKVNHGSDEEPVQQLEPQVAKYLADHATNIPPEVNIDFVRDLLMNQAEMDASSVHPQYSLHVSSHELVYDMFKLMVTVTIEY